MCGSAQPRVIRAAQCLHGSGPVTRGRCRDTGPPSVTRLCHGPSVHTAGPIEAAPPPPSARRHFRLHQQTSRPLHPDQPDVGQVPAGPCSHTPHTCPAKLPDAVRVRPAGRTMRSVGHATVRDGRLRGQLEGERGAPRPKHAHGADVAAGAARARGPIENVLVGQMAASIQAQAPFPRAASDRFGHEGRTLSAASPKSPVKSETWLSVQAIVTLAGGVLRAPPSRAWTPQRACPSLTPARAPLRAQRQRTQSSSQTAGRLRPCGRVGAHTEPSSGSRSI